MKIAIIGGGSTYTPEAIEGLLIKAKDLGLTQITLMDIDPERLQVVGDFVKRMAKHAQSDVQIETTDNQRDAVTGASFVLTQFRVGKMPARHQDILLGLRHNLIGQETTGIGGMAKALRTIPVIEKLCADIKELSPDAWIINFTNPSGLITEYILNHTDCKCIGLCNVPLEMKMNVAKHLKVPDQAVKMDFVGLNHLGWVRKVEVNGEDITDTLIAFLASEEGPKNIPDIPYKPELIESLKAVPLWYNQYYYYPETMYNKIKDKKKTRAEEVMEVENELLAKYKDPAVVTKPEELEKRGGAYYSKIAVDIINSIVNDTGEEHIINVKNQGAIPDLPDHSVVETVAVVGKDGGRPVPTTPLEPSIRALIQQAKAYEELTIEAAMNKSWAAAYRAILTNPLGPGGENAKEVLDDLLKTNKLEYK